MTANSVNSVNSVIFCDFDGTITKNDTVDHFLSLFANENWLKIEELWKNGEIGSKECLTRQLECIDHISEKQVNDFIENIEIDDNFIDFIKAVNREKIELYIVSDGFDFFIKNTLKKYGIDNIKVFSNKLNFNNGKPVPFYPHHQTDCKKNAGMCKCEVINKLKNGKQVVYIGDGTSDICASHLADTLFAKSTLAKYCNENDINHIKFDTFEDIYEHLNLNLKIKSGENINVKSKILVG